MKTILLLNDTSDHGNWGSVAGAEALKGIIARTCPDARIESIASKWTTRRFRQLPGRLGGGVYWKRKRILDRFSMPFRFTPSVVDEFELMADEWLRGGGREATEELLIKLRGADAVVFHAEGSTYRNNVSAIRCLFALWVARTRLDTPAVFLNGSVTLTVVDPVLPAMVAKTFRAIDGVAVREPCSQRNVKRWIPDIDAELIPDSVFSFSPVQADTVGAHARRLLERLEGNPFFCLSLSMLQSMQPGYMSFGAGRSSMYALVQALKRLVPRPVLLARDPMDQKIIRELAKATDAEFVGPEFHFRDLQAVFARSTFLVSGRYHHLILATISGCPGIPLRTSSHKVDGLCELLGGELGEPFDATDLWTNKDAIVERARDILGDQEKRERLAAMATEFRSRVDRLGEMVRDVL